MILVYISAAFAFASLGTALYFAFLHLCLETKNSRTTTAAAYLAQAKQKNNVPEWRFAGHPGGAASVPYVGRIIKHLSRATYVYTVGRKEYKIKYKAEVTKRRLPKIISVRYSERMPNIACAETPSGTVYYIFTLVSLFFLIMFAALAFIAYKSI